MLLKQEQEGGSGDKGDFCQMKTLAEMQIQKNPATGKF